ncbi:hypothetical protein [Rhodopirellula europaea]|uniref:hypothetical protein n=1 Tax=Rhodopirellula europaea TaxID=1263866 RepID=UPI003D28044B|tara:strand:+ start:4923 stop:6740 length:1818 start_codon:yes stop_codon:yes gene_type:complete
MTDPTHLETSDANPAEILTQFLANRWVWSCFFALAAAAMTWQTVWDAPNHDESAHLAAGIATMRTGDPGYYRVNPPLHRLVSGAFCDLLMNPKLPPLYIASMAPSGNREEFALGSTLIQLNPTSYRNLFIVGRLVRIPFFLITAAMLLLGFPMLPSDARRIACLLFLTSPMVLGHGWAISPDAFSGYATIFLLAATFQWLAHRNWINGLIVGATWGVAIGIKFTFCPIYVVWPIGLFAHEYVMGRGHWKNAAGIVAAHFLHGFVALWIVILLYFASDVGTTLQDHNFKSQRMISLSQPFAQLPSPFPQQFLIGIDEQQLDIENGIPTYFCGVEYPDGVWWYYLVGTIAKEQIAFAFGLLSCLAGVVIQMRSSKSAPREAACLALTAFTAMAVLLLLSAHPSMALNIRYGFPAICSLYIAIGIGTQWLMRRRLMHINAAILAVFLISVGSVASCFPYYYSYTSPLFGGMYRMPPAMHDSNFDRGQDLWRLEKWLASHPAPDDCQRYTHIETPFPPNALQFHPNPAPPQVLQRLLSQRRNLGNENLNLAESTVELVATRGLGVPAPWSRSSGIVDAKSVHLVEELLRLEPDRFLTPTVAIYRFRSAP